HRLEQLLLAAEVAVDRLFRDAGLARHLVDAGALIAVLEEVLRRDVEHLLLLGFGDTLADGLGTRSQGRDALGLAARAAVATPVAAVRLGRHCGVIRKSRPWVSYASAHRFSFTRRCTRTSAPCTARPPLGRARARFQPACNRRTACSRRR